jgi:3-methyladenine DNA glycosylase AlkD
MSLAEGVKRALQKLASKEKASGAARFFKTAPGQYGEGDVFIGVTVPEQRGVAREFTDLPLLEISELLSSPIHEHRLTALLILVDKFQRADQAGRSRLLKYYLSQTRAINNWDLVDVTADKIVGVSVLTSRDFAVLDKLADSKNMWQRRIAMVATLALIRNGELEQTWRLAEKFLTESHDLMHKASGWMLREAGKREERALRKFLDKHASRMPRTMLRYAIERLSPQERAKYLAKKK